MATIGSTLSPSTNTVYYDSLLSTTLAAYRKTMYDNIFKERAFLQYLRMSDAIVKQDGGERIAAPLMYGDNDTVKTHGGYDVIDTTPQDGMTTAFYEWAEIAGSISISRLEERQNAGEGRMLNLLEQRTKQAEMSIAEKLNNDLILGTANTNTFVPDISTGGRYGVLPLAYFLRKANATDPLVGGNVGNIAAATYSWWRAKSAVFDSATLDTGNSFALSVSTWKGVAKGLKTMYNYCSRGSGGSPDLCVATQEVYEEYENSLDDKIRYSNTKMADMGFDTIKIKGATMLWDEQVPNIDDGYEPSHASYATSGKQGSAFFINTKFYKLIIDSQTDLITTPFMEPENQTVKTAKILFMGNAAVFNMRKHGVCYAISCAIAS